MKKHTTKTYGKAKKAGQTFGADNQDAIAKAVQRYQIKQEREIEQVLSPFWAWRSLNG